MENGIISGTRTREERALDRHREAVGTLLAKAFKQALKKKKVVVRVPPGYGKTHSAIEQIAQSDKDLRVLWFSPEVRPGSVAARVVDDLKAKGVSEVQLLYRLSELPPEEQDELVKWNRDGKQVKVLAHAYLPLLFHDKPSARLSPLRQATLIVIDENPWSSLFTTCGGPGDLLVELANLTPESKRQETKPQRASTHLPLDLFLGELDEAKYLKETVEQATSLLKHALDQPAVRVLRSSKNKKIRKLGGPELGALLRTLLKHEDQYSLPGGIERAWMEKVPFQEMDELTRAHVKHSIRGHLTHLRRNIKHLMDGGDAHGLSLVLDDHSDVPYIRCAYFQKPSFGRRGVLHLDAFAEDLLVRQWLEHAKILPLTFPKSRPAQCLELAVMRTPHPHDTLRVNRRAVANRESQARHVAVVGRGLHLLGDKVLILSHKKFNNQYKNSILKVRRSEMQQVEFLHWNASLGVDGFKGYDAFVVDESRLPNSVVEFDFSALDCIDSDKLLIKRHLEISDFLQLVHRVRPLLHRGKCEKCNADRRCTQCKRRSTILAAFNPLEIYGASSAQEGAEVGASLLTTTLTKIVTREVTPFRGKSKHITFLEIARIAMKEALDNWKFIPRRLIILLAEGPNSGNPEEWDPILLDFIKNLSKKYPVFELLDDASKPIDRQQRGLNNLLKEITKSKIVGNELDSKVKSAKIYDLGQVQLEEVVLSRKQSKKGSRPGPKPKVIIWCPSNTPSITTVDTAYRKLKDWDTRRRKSRKHVNKRKSSAITTLVSDPTESISGATDD